MLLRNRNIKTEPSYRVFRVGPDGHQREIGSVQAANWMLAQTKARRLYGLNAYVKVDSTVPPRMDKANG